MKLQILSDLHCEAYANPSHIWRFITPQAPTALIAGDIDSRKFEATLTELATKFEKVIAVLGNHEYYHKSINWKPDLSQLPANVTILNPGTVEHEGVLFIGATLWTDFKNQDWFVMHAAKNGISDFHVIRDFSPDKAYNRFMLEKAYIRKMLELNRGKKTVILTHFVPSYNLINQRWKKFENMLNYYFSANCDDLIEDSEVALWVFGHTHDPCDIELGGVRCVCNPLGYPKENPTYRDLIIEV